MNSSPITRRLALLGALAGIAPFGSGAAAATARAFPSRPVHLVVAAPAGGPPDALARLVAAEMAATLGQPVIVQNKPGGIGIIAARHVARANPDGHTLLLSWIGNATSQGLVSGAPVSLERDFAHITQLTSTPNVLVAAPGAPFRSLAALLRLARARPGELAYASSGTGSSSHLAMELLQQRSGTSLRHVPYRGGLAALEDVLRGEVDVMFVNQDAVGASLRSGRLAALAVSGRHRHPLCPQVPTVAESGFPGFEASTWAGLSAPAGTPPETIAAIHAAALQALRGPVGRRYETAGSQTVGSTPAEFQAFLREETRKWMAVIRATGLATG